MGWFNHHLATVRFKAEADGLWKQYLGCGETAVAGDF